MSLIRRIIGLVVWPMRGMAALGRRLAGRVGSRSELVAHAKQGIGTTRRLAAGPWRKTIRWLTVVTGFAVYTTMQLTMAYLIDELWWWFIVAFFIIAMSLALAIARPMIAYMVWLVTSPMGFIFLRLDFGKGLPVISYDRIAILFLAAVLVARTLVNRVPIRKMIVAEWFMMAFMVLTVGASFIFQTKDLSGLLSDRILDHFGLAVILYFLTKAVVTKKEHVGWAFVGLLWVGIYCAISGFYEHFTGTMWFSSFMGSEYRLAYSDVALGRATGPLLNPTPYGTFLGITTFIAFHLSAWTTNKAKKLFYYASMALMIVGCYFSLTRGAYLTMFIYVLAMPLLSRGKRMQYVAFTTAAVLVGLMVIPVLLSNLDFNKRMSKVSTIYQRVAVTATLINIIQHNFWLGVGLGNVNEALDQYVTNAGSLSGLYARPYFPNQHKRQKIITSHNSILTILAEQGIAGGFLYIGSIVAFMIAMFQVRARLPDKGLLGKDFVAVVIVGAVGHLFSIATYDIRFFKYPTYVFWIMFALVIRLNELRMQEQEQAVPQEAAAPLAGRQAVPVAAGGSAF